MYPLNFYILGKSLSGFPTMLSLTEEGDESMPPGGDENMAQGGALSWKSL